MASPCTWTSPLFEGHCAEAGKGKTIRRGSWFFLSLQWLSYCHEFINVDFSDVQLIQISKNVWLSMPNWHSFHFTCQCVPVRAGTWQRQLVPNLYTIHVSDSYRIFKAPPVERSQSVFLLTCSQKKVRNKVFYCLRLKIQILTCFVLFHGKCFRESLTNRFREFLVNVVISPNVLSSWLWILYGEAFLNC